MRSRTALALVLALAACKQQAPAPQPLAAPAAKAPAAQDGIRGTVAEKIDAAQYSYLKLKTPAGEVWTAVPKTDKAVGAEVTVVNAAWMENFQSKSLNRTWERIAFGTLGEGAGAAALPAGHPSTAGQGPGVQGAGMFAAAAAGDTGAGLPKHPAPSAAADLGAIKVAKAAGKQGRTVAEIWRTRAALKDKDVAVRGKVVKATNGVLGKNWLHLRDGTGEGATSDLVVSSTDTASVGDTVLVTGVVHLDKDLGAGYHYDVIVEDAKIKAE